MTVVAGKNKLLFSYSGTIDSPSIAFILAQIEDYLSSFSLVSDSKRKVLEITTEILQNIYHHSTLKNLNLQHFEIKKEDGGFEISGSNIIHKTNTESFKKRIDHINSLSPAELTIYYRDILKNGLLRGEGAGLGLIDMRRKSGKAILYKFVPQDNNYYLFTVIVPV